MRSWFRFWREVPPEVSPAEPAPPEWALSLMEAVQKQGRANVKQGARLEAALTENDRQIRALADTLEQLSASVRPTDARATATLHAPLFDALDALDEATRIAADPHLVAGLARVAERVEAFCQRAGFVRVRCEGRAPEPRLLRVVGTESHPNVPAGHVSRVVRSAILHGEVVVREGEVIVSAAAQPPQGAEDEHMGY